MERKKNHAFVEEQQHLIEDGLVIVCRESESIWERLSACKMIGRLKTAVQVSELFI